MAGESVPPPAVMRSVTATPSAAFPSASLAVTVTVAVERGAPLLGFILTLTVLPVAAVTPVAADTLTVTRNVGPPIPTVTVRV